MNWKKVGGREYKLMLKPRRFAGDHEVLMRASDEFWSVARDRIRHLVLDTDGTLDRIRDAHRRLVTFYDTRGRIQRSNGYLLRERVGSDGERQLSLKFRHPDRYIAQDRSPRSLDSLNGDIKFEEDIKPPLATLYSFSSGHVQPAGAKLDTRAIVTRLFPGLGDELSGVEEDDQIAQVAGFTAREIVVSGSDFELDDHP
jgi:hypothetical protein